MAEEKPNEPKRETISIRYEDPDGNTKTIEAPLRVFSLKWRAGMREILSRHLAEGEAIDAKFRESLGVSPEDTLAEAIAQGKAREITEYRDKVSEYSERTSIEIVQATIDTRQLTTEQTELITSGPDSEFWQSVDFEGIRIAADRFRGKVR